MFVSDEDIFTKKELESWVETMGGYGAIITLPDNTYRLTQLKRKQTYKHYNGREAVIERIIEGNRYFCPHVRFKMSYFDDIDNETFYDVCDLLFSDMRNAKPRVIPKAYPHLCKICGAPSRKCAEYILCSNTKCKSWKYVKMKLPKPKLMPGDTKENPIVVRCESCGKIITGRKNKVAGGAYCINCDYVNEFKFETGKWYVFRRAAGRIVCRLNRDNEWGNGIKYVKTTKV